MSEVKEERITNAEVRGRLFNVPTTQNKIAKLQLTFIGKVVRIQICSYPPNYCQHGATIKGSTAMFYTPKISQSSNISRLYFPVLEK